MAAIDGLNGLLLAVPDFVWALALVLLLGVYVLRRLLDDLVDQLSRRAEVNHPFAVFAQKPLRDQEANERLAAAGRQLEGNVGFILRTGDVTGEQRALVWEHALEAPPGEFEKEFLRRVGGRGPSGKIAKCHRKIDSATNPNAGRNYFGG